MSEKVCYEETWTYKDWRDKNAVTLFEEESRGNFSKRNLPESLSQAKDAYSQF